MGFYHCNARPCRRSFIQFTFIYVDICNGFLKSAQSPQPPPHIALPSYINEQCHCIASYDACFASVLFIPTDSPFCCFLLKSFISKLNGTWDSPLSSIFSFEKVCSSFSSLPSPFVFLLKFCMVPLREYLQSLCYSIETNRFSYANGDTSLLRFKMPDFVFLYLMVSLYMQSRTFSTSVFFRFECI